MLQFPFNLILTILILVFVRPITVLFHELGHAIPAILLTKDKVTIYIGSYGDPAKSKQLNVGLLTVWFRYNPFSWRLGLCVPGSKSITTWQKIIYILTGPFTSLLFAFVIVYFIFNDKVDDNLAPILIIFLGSFILDLIINLTPRAKPIKLYNGKFAYNDGYTILMLLRTRNLPPEYQQAQHLIMQKQFDEAIAVSKSMLVDGVHNPEIFRLAIAASLLAKNYEEAKHLSEEFIELGKMNSDDYGNAGLAFSHLGLHEKAMELFNASLRKNPNNKYTLNNKGYTLNLQNKYKEAIPLFDTAIEIDNTYAYSYCNRGLAKIKLGDPESGLADVHHSFKLDSNNPYGYLNLGIYYFDKGEYEQALKQFKKAKELDSTTFGIDEHIDKTERLVS